MKKTSQPKHLSLKKWLAPLMLPLFCLPSCSLMVKRHMPYFLSQAEVIFEDDFGNIYFENDSLEPSSLCKYSHDKKNHFESIEFDNEETNVEYGDGAANSNYLFVYLHSRSFKSNIRYIEMYDKSFSLVKTFNLAEDEYLKGLVCSENYLYLCLKKENDYSFSIIKWLYDNDTTETIADDLTGPYSFEDDGERFYFNTIYERCSFGKYDETTLLTMVSEEHFTTDVFKLYTSYNSLNIVVDGQTNSFKKEYNHILFGKAYLTKENVVFAMYKYEKNFECASFCRHCICGIKNFYLYSFDFSTNSLSLLNTYEPGTFLIDYKDGNAVYYFEGGLYIDGALVRECETIKTKELVEIDYLSDHQYELDYHLSYYGGDILGI